MPLPRSFATTPHRDLDLELVHGQWPTDISGELVIAAPGTKGDLDYAIFSAGHMLRLSLNPGTFGAAPDRWAWRTKKVRSPSARLQEKCPDVFHSNGAALSSPFGLPNQANTAPSPLPRIVTFPDSWTLATVSSVAEKRAQCVTSTTRPSS